MGRLDDKLAIVTGASRGIGAAISLALSKEGAHVVMQYNNSQDKAQSIHRAININGGSGIIVQADLTSQKGCDELIESVKNQNVPIDILVNNAGANLRTSYSDIAFDTLDYVFRLNVFAPIYLSQQASQYMESGSSIINISSVAGQKTVEKNGLEYGASKAALNMATRQISRTLAPQGIRVNAIAPSFTDTDMLAKYTSEEKAAKAAKLPLGMLIDPKDIAELCMYLAEGKGPYAKMTGAIIPVDSGASAK